jgi:hypothetical protein
MQQECNKSATSALRGCYESVKKVSQECYFLVPRRSINRPGVATNTCTPPSSTWEVLQECYKSVTRVSQERHKNATRVLLECYKSVTRVSQECCKGVTKVLRACICFFLGAPPKTHVARIPQGFPAATRVLQGVTRVLQGRYKGVRRVSQGRCIGVTRVVQKFSKG